MMPLDVFTPQNMRERARAAFRSEMPQMLLNIKKSFEQRVTLCFKIVDCHFEHLI